MTQSTSIILVRQAPSTVMLWALMARSPVPIGDDWEAHREKVKELFIDDGSSLSDIQNVLRQTHDFLSYIGDHADLPRLNAIEPAWLLMKKTSTIRGAP